MLQTLKLNNKKRKKSLFYEEKRLTPELETQCKLSKKKLLLIEMLKLTGSHHYIHMPDKFSVFVTSIFSSEKVNFDRNIIFLEQQICRC